MDKTLKALVYIQANLKAPKDQKSNRYNYRNIEDVNEAVKPLAASKGCAVVYGDEFKDGLCVSTCTLMCEDGSISAQGVAMVNSKPQHMSIEQSSGAASSYARKYAAQGLFAIDSSENDPDRANETQQETRKAPNARNTAVKRLHAAIEANCAANGGDVAKVKEGVKNRADYEDTADFYNRVAEEFETNG